MPKMKTKAAAKKRFKKVGKGGGLFKRAKSFRRHLLTKKSAKRKRRLRKGAYISNADKRSVARLLPS